MSTDTIKERPSRVRLVLELKGMEDEEGLDFSWDWTIKQESESEYIEKTIEKHLKK